MKTILLYGFLGRRFGCVHRYDVQTPGEAVRALTATLDGFRQALIDGGAYRLLVGGKRSLGREDLHDPVSDRETIRIVPVVAGAGRGLGQILVGAALITAAAFTGGGALIGAAASGTAAFTAANVAYSVGVALVLGGVSQMLFSPKQTGGQTADRPDNKPSFSFDGAVNTAAQGNPVAVLYGGPLIVGSQVLSAGLSVEQV